jgi:large-conductance mechanosensitive channel
MAKEPTLKDLKQDYKEIQEKYSLPSFEEINEDFQIEKLAGIETDFLIREIRKIVADRLFNYMRFIESILNPVNVPMFIFSITKKITSEEKEKLTEMYKKLAEKELELIEVDIRFSEEKEVQFIKTSYDVWQEVKEKMSQIVEVIKKNWDNKASKNNRGYFG